MYNFLKINFLGLILVGQLLNAQYDNGVLISNEGNFGSPNADVSYIDQDTYEISNNIYQAVNNEPLGDVLQHVRIHGDKAYLVMNNSNKIVVVDRASFEKIDVITEQISLPRFIGFANDKLFVSNSSGRYVSIYNEADRSFITKIEQLGSVNNVEVAGNYVFVQQGNWGSGNSVAVIDATTNTLNSILEVDEGINGIISNGDFLYTLSSTANGTVINKIDATDLSLAATIIAEDITGAGKIAYSDGNLYFIGNSTDIFSVEDNLMSEPSLVTSVPDNAWSTLYGFGVVDDYILTSDSNGFTQASIIRAYSKETGSLVATFNAGIGSNGFYDNIVEGLNTSDVVLAINKVQVYPNPVADRFYIQGVEAAQVEIYNTLGSLVKTVQFNGQAISVEGLAKGVYFVVISNDNMKVSKKVILK
ncbi:T9SS type A sorting domain-containing protein [Weeksellaceae bacterium KMM 9713]|uniref:T9SS type A sorting domain-containing protein n=1 Tax=Profundicola chukchiensis TaxID=2961959 RepID=A0A9X4N0K2_9FLAO|nr:DUF5074 domain-containing protein [Profundicola chukchiensis]MDG4946532.1 T9SS type A sorting domain-containing protein [Profundicola chukchiensis]